eukprot:scaffold58938_cov53-Attheya_sp.AAC.2
MKSLRQTSSKHTQNNIPFYSLLRTPSYIAYVTLRTDSSIWLEPASIVSKQAFIAISTFHDGTSYVGKEGVISYRQQGT